MVVRVVVSTVDSRGRTGETARVTIANVVDGAATITDRNLNTGANGQTAAVSVRYEVVEVQQWSVPGPNGSWDGVQASTSVTAP